MTLVFSTQDKACTLYALLSVKNRKTPKNAQKDAQNSQARRRRQEFNEQSNKMQICDTARNLCIPAQLWFDFSFSNHTHLTRTEALTTKPSAFMSSLFFFPCRVPYGQIQKLQCIALIRATLCLFNLSL